MTRLVRANLLLLVLLPLHAADHMFWQPSRHLGIELITTGLAGSAAAVVVLVLALARNALAAPAAVVVGFGTAIGFMAAHVLPRWSAWSDPYADAGLSWLSWVLMFAPAVVAAWLGILGLREMHMARARSSSGATGRRASELRE